MNWLRGMFGKRDASESEASGTSETRPPRRPRQPGDGYFADDWAPEPDELKEWAYSDAPAPSDDFEVAVFDRVEPAFMVELIEDDRCPKRAFFYRCLYRRFGACFRGGGRRPDQRAEANRILGAVPEPWEPQGRGAEVAAAERTTGQKLLSAWREDANRLLSGEVDWSPDWHALAEKRLAELGVD